MAAFSGKNGTAFNALGQVVAKVGWGGVFHPREDSANGTVRESGPAVGVLLEGCNAPLGGV